MKNLYCVLVFAHFLGQLCAQTTVSDPDSLHIKIWLDSIKANIDHGKSDVALNMLDSAELMLNRYRHMNTPLVVYLYEYRGLAWYNKGQVGKCIPLFEKALSASRQYYPPDGIVVATSLNNVGNLYKVQHNFRRSRECLEEALQIRLKRIPQNVETGQSWYNLGGLEFEVGNFSTALADYQRAEIILREHPEALVSLSTVYFNMAGVYDEWGDFDLAIEYYRKALAIRKATLPPRHIRIARCLLQLGGSYENKYDLVHAGICYRDAIAICEALAPDVDSSELSNCYANLATLLQKQGNYAEGILQERHCLAIRESCTWLGGGWVADAHITLAEMFGKQGQLDSAVVQAEAAIRIWEKTYGGFYHPYALEGLNKLAEYRTEQGQLPEAWTLTETALENALRSPDPDLRTLQRIYFIKAKICHKHYYSTRNPADLKAALPHLRELLRLFSEQYRRFGHEESRLAAAAAFYPVAEEAITICAELYTLSGDEPLIDLAFDFAEQTKSVLLRANANEAKALFSSQLPVAVFDKELSLKNELRDLQDEKTDLLFDGTSINDGAVLNLDTAIFEVNRRMDSLHRDFKQRYPAYYNALYDASTIPLTVVQTQLLVPGQTLVAYFVGDKAVFVIGANSSGRFLRQIGTSEEVVRLTKAMHKNMSAKFAPIADYVQAARQLYGILLAPVKNYLSTDLIIVPDGVLGNIPFEALLTGEVADPTRPHGFPYLLLDHMVSYSPSATMLREMQDKSSLTSRPGYLAAFAPYFTGDTAQLRALPIGEDSSERKTFLPLEHSGEEVFNIGKIMNGDVFYHQTATKALFDSIAGRYRILHLATHGQINGQSSDYSFLAFADGPGSIEKQLLYVRDIYHLRLHADLITLSACETGLGEIRRGEGTFSLARAFAYAGAKSIVTSLWKVNDASTKKLMVAFYRNLKKGMPENAALSKAKRSYIKANKAEANPYFWAPFIVIGDARALH